MDRGIEIRAVLLGLWRAGTGGVNSPARTIPTSNRTVAERIIDLLFEASPRPATFIPKSASVN
jgi:hypothetical protein